MSDRRYFSGDSEAQALMEAAIHFGVEPEDLAFERVEKKHGFVRRRKRVMIEVDPQDPTKSAVRADAGEAARIEETTAEVSEATSAPEPRATRAEEPEPQEPARPSHPEARTEAATPAAEGVASSTVSVEAPPEAEEADGPEETAPRIDDKQVARAVDLLLDLADLDVRPEVRAEDGDFHVNLSGPEREWLLEEEASLLFSLEHLTLRMLWQQEGRFSSLRVDTEGYREAREAELRERARTEARKVLEQGDAVELEALDPAERRIVHLAVQELEGVESHSRGRGFRKRVRIVRGG